MTARAELRPLATHNTCHYCKLSHRLVEAGGMWHCPNVLCTGPGAAHWRSTLTSYRDMRDGRSHTVDDEEAVTRGLAHAYTLTDDPALAAHIRASASNWRRAAAPTGDRTDG